MATHFDVEVKYNNAAVKSQCPVCGNCFKPSIGEWEFLKGSWDPICEDCTAEQASGQHQPNTFITKDGSVIQCERFMQGPKLHDGYIWWHQHGKVWKETPEQPAADDSKLFGYDKTAFMQRQYQRLTKDCENDLSRAGIDTLSPAIDHLIQPFAGSAF